MSWFAKVGESAGKLLENVSNIVAPPADSSSMHNQNNHHGYGQSGYGQGVAQSSYGNQWQPPAHQTSQYSTPSNFGASVSASGVSSTSVSYGYSTPASTPSTPGFVASPTTPYNPSSVPPPSTFSSSNSGGMSGLPGTSSHAQFPHPGFATPSGASIVSGATTPQSYASTPSLSQNTPIASNPPSYGSSSNYPNNYSTPEAATPVSMSSSSHQQTVPGYPGTLSTPASSAYGVPPSKVLPPPQTPLATPNSMTSQAYPSVPTTPQQSYGYQSSSATSVSYAGAQAPPTNIPFFSPSHTMKKKTIGQPATGPAQKYVPVEDGFISTAGNPERGAKYGNPTGTNRVTTANVIGGIGNDNHLLKVGYGGGIAGVTPENNMIAPPPTTFSSPPSTFNNPVGNSVSTFAPPSSYSGVGVSGPVASSGNQYGWQSQGQTSALQSSHSTHFSSGSGTGYSDQSPYNPQAGKGVQQSTGYGNQFPGA